jgi:hypothetical protein
MGTLFIQQGVGPARRVETRVGRFVERVQIDSALDDKHGT